jgi:ATP-binding cassette subfamily F protein uup
MSGEIRPDNGSVEIGPTVNIGYFPQESTNLPDDMKVIDYIREAGEYLQSGNKMLSASQMLETFLFTPASQWTTLQKLSGGEKRRLHLLRILMGTPNFLFLDEPGNDLDIETLTILENYLDDFPGAVVAVSHDRYFLDRISDKILAFEGMGKLKEYPGNYSDYILNAEKNEQIKEQEPLRNKNKNYREEGKQQRIKFTYKEQKEFEQIDDQIAAVENELIALNEQINLAASDYLLLEKLNAIRQETEQRQYYLMERWVYLSELAEKIDKQGKS